MPTLLVVRHAAAQSSAPSDRERALTDTGRRQAAVTGRVLAAVDAPDSALVSVAHRAHETFTLARDHGGWDVPVELVDDLYDGGVREVLAAIGARGGQSGTLLVVGHQPWCAELVELLTGARVRMDTAAVASIQVGPAWDALDPQWCSLQWFAGPRTLAPLTAG